MEPGCNMTFDRASGHSVIPQSHTAEFWTYIYPRNLWKGISALVEAGWLVGGLAGLVSQAWMWQHKVRNVVTRSASRSKASGVQNPQP